MLGLNVDIKKVHSDMVTTSESLTRYEIDASLGIVEAVVEGSFPGVSLGGFGIQKGGGLERLEEAREQLAFIAADRGGNAIVGFRFQLMGRDLEKGVLAYGTAVKCRKSEG